MKTEIPHPHGQTDVADFEQHIAALTAGRSEPDRSDLERYLRANPGMTVRDWKGKGPSVPLDADNWDKPWHKLATSEVRREATIAFARELPQNVRQAAARDRGLIWNDLARKYRLRLPSDPPPGQKVDVSPTARPAAVHETLPRVCFCTRF